jgi:hypothetical protein
MAMELPSIEPALLEDVAGGAARPPLKAMTVWAMPGLKPVQGLKPLPVPKAMPATPPMRLVSPGKAFSLF